MEFEGEAINEIRIRERKKFSPHVLAALSCGNSSGVLRTDQFSVCQSATVGYLGCKQLMSRWPS
jgi:hypothetical protein